MIKYLKEQIYISENYLEELNRLEKEIQAGRISMNHPAFKDRNDVLKDPKILGRSTPKSSPKNKSGQRQRLVRNMPGTQEVENRSGMIRHPERFAKGIDRRAGRIASQSGAKIKKNILGDLSGPHTTPSERFTKKGKRAIDINMPTNKEDFSNSVKKHSGQGFDDIDWVITRAHEADEAKYGRPNIDKYNALGVIPFKKGKRQQSGHASPKIIANEKGLRDFANNAYGQGLGTTAVRKKSGEDDWLKRTSKKQIDKLHKKSENNAKMEELGKTGMLNMMLSGEKEGIKNKIRSFGSGLKDAIYAQHKMQSIDLDKPKESKLKKFLKSLKKDKK